MWTENASKYRSTGLTDRYDMTLLMLKYTNQPNDVYIQLFYSFNLKMLYLYLLCQNHLHLAF